MNKVFIGLGSNIEPREGHLNDAIKILSENEEITLLKRSSIYETEPVGYTKQDKFLNMVIQVETSIKKIDLLDFCQEIERELGREKTILHGPRTVDLDILLFNAEFRQLDRLQIPHPRMHLRAFVLVPLHEIAPEIVIPTSGKPVEELLEDVSTRELRSVVKWN